MTALTSVGGSRLVIGSGIASRVSDDPTGSIRKPGNFQAYSKAPSYMAWSGMWGVYLTDLLVFTCAMVVQPTTFPAGTRFEWNVTPAPDWGGINGYLALQYGNYDDSTSTLTPRQLKNITAMSMNVDWTFTGDNASGLLCECWLTATSHATGSITTGGADLLAEVGFMAKVSPHAQSYLEAGTPVGTGSFVSGGVTWNVIYHADGTSGHYYLAYRNGYVDHKGVLPFKDYFTFLVAAGAVNTAGAFTGNEWFNGLAFGTECDSGAGALTINTFTPTYS